MLLDPQERRLISNLGWIDKGSIWIYDVEKGKAHACKISDADYLLLKPGNSGLFSVMHHYNEPRLDISIHAFAEPEVELARTSLKGGIQSVSGEFGCWTEVPSFYVSHANRIVDNNTWFGLVNVMADGRMEIRGFDWYTDERFDKGYQGIIGVFQVPGQDVLLVSVQRSSILIVEDAKTGQEIGSIDLGGIGGNPVLRFNSQNDVIWASDYDSITTLSTDTLEVISRVCLQDTDNSVSHLFIGDYLFDQSGLLCLVPRPFSADALILDTRTLEVKTRVDLGEQPLEGAILSNGQIICRNWKNGATLEGRASVAN